MHYHKEKTNAFQITKIKDPEFVYIALLQHTGAPAKPLVKPGDKVLRGQLIGSTDAFVTANVHSSVSGEVVEIIKIRNALGLFVDAVKIKNDFQDSPDLTIIPKKDLEALSADEIRDAVREAGIVGMGGAAFPTHVKISPPVDKNVDTLILNAAECEPFLTADHRLLLEKTEDVIYGLKLIAKAINARKVYIAIEDNKKDAIKTLKQLKLGKFAAIKVLKTKYPAGAEKVLVKTITGRRVANKGIPLDVGVVVANVATAYQTAQTIKTGMPLVERIVTVSGEFKNPGNYLVKIGTLFSDIVSAADLAGDSSWRIIAGGPMMGHAVESLDVPVAKGTSGLVLLAVKEKEASSCIRCGKCVDACPLGLQPYQDKGMDECMECGRCAYECPAGIFIVQKTRVYKNELKKSN